LGITVTYDANKIIIESMTRIEEHSNFSNVMKIYPVAPQVLSLSYTTDIKTSPVSFN
jgi:hypothetical protein